MKLGTSKTSASPELSNYYLYDVDLAPCKPAYTRNVNSKTKTINLLFSLQVGIFF
jgi:hypothetical protein